LIDLETKVEEIGPDTIALEYKNQVDHPSGFGDLTVEREWFPLCVRFSKPARSTDYHTNSASSRSGLALGDLADCREGQQVPTTAQAAFQQATGWNLWASRLIGLCFPSATST